VDELALVENVLVDRRLDRVVLELVDAVVLDEDTVANE